MNGHQRRKLKKMESIKRAALGLFHQHRSDRVSVDEIANRADVSKATVYKYFGSKENLYQQVVKMIMEEDLITMEIIVNSKMSFSDKLKSIILARMDFLNSPSGEFWKNIWENEAAAAKYSINYHNTIKKLVDQLFEPENKEELIDSSISSQELHQYLEIFMEGLPVVLARNKLIPPDRNSISRMVDLYLFGLIYGKD